MAGRSLGPPGGDPEHGAGARGLLTREKFAADSEAVSPEQAVRLPPGITPREADFLLRALLRVKERRFGRLTVTVGDGRVVDIELVEKVHHDVLKTF